MVFNYFLILQSLKSLTAQIQTQLFLIFPWTNKKKIPNTSFSCTCMPFHCLTPGKQKPLKVKSLFPPLKSAERNHEIKFRHNKIDQQNQVQILKYDSAKHVTNHNCRFILINITAKYSETNTATVMLLAKNTCTCFVLKQCNTAN